MLVERPTVRSFAIAPGGVAVGGRDALASRRSRSTSHVLADPGHAWKYGTSVRVSAGRDVFLEEVKDSALAIYSRDVAASRRRTARRRRRLLTPHGRDEHSRWRRSHDLDFLVTEADLPLPVAYRNASSASTRSADARTTMTEDARPSSARPYRPLVHWRPPADALCVGPPRRFPALPAPEARYFDVAADARVLAHCHWQPRPGGTSDAPPAARPRRLEPRRTTCAGIADKAWARGLERRPAEPAQLRRHRAPLARASITPG